MNEDVKILNKELSNELKNILSSPPFKRSRRSSELLSYLVKHKLSRDESVLTGVIISQDVFGRMRKGDEDDTIVRVSVSKLRKMLKTYYYETGKDSNWRISLPKSGYEINFKAATEIAVPIKRADGRALSHYFKALSICVATLIILVVGFQFVENRSPQKLADIVTPYPSIHVFPFENLTQDEKHDDLGFAFQRQLVLDLQPFRVVRVQEADQPLEKAKSSKPNLTGYGISGQILEVDPQINLLITLTDFSNQKIVLKKRIERDLDGSTYFDLLSEISSKLSYNFASPEGELVKLQLDQLRVQMAGENHIIGNFSAFECYSKVIKYQKNPEEISFIDAYSCLKLELESNPDDSVLLAELAMIENQLAFYAKNPEYKVGHPVYENIEIDPNLTIEQSYELMRRSISIDPENDLSYAYLGNLYFREGDLLKAEHNLKQAVKLNRGNPEHLTTLARILAHKGDWNQSIALSEEAIRRSITPDPSTYVPMFLCAIVERDGAEAEKYLPKINDMFGTYHQAMYKFAVASMTNDMETIEYLKPKLIKNGKRFNGDVLHIMKVNGGSEEIFQAFQRELDLRGI